MNIQELNNRAVRASVDVVARATVDDLGRPTPCAGWTLADLLAHMTVQHHGFAAAARGAGADLAVWKVRPLGDDAVPLYIKAAEDVLAAFAEDGVLEREFTLPEFTQPEFGRGPVFPAAQAIGFHFIDYLVHAWDVARSLGVEFTPASDLAEAAWPITLAVPDDERRTRPGAAFQPSLPAPGDAPRFDRILALLGRSPTWEPRV
ncbi:TIGR03086 family metal-binding protein [Streptosporangium sp. NPDC051023]|uniref:TIGR03086 family metal-binding protein n=1 Tax=Streptosporangium sp. NPDC051023 TaxID=3155410 RepID=UPI00344B3549